MTDAQTLYQLHAISHSFSLFLSFSLSPSLTHALQYILPAANHIKDVISMSLVLSN
jgi:hypothetical protein